MELKLLIIILLSIGVAALLWIVLKDKFFNQSLSRQEIKDRYEKGQLNGLKQLKEKFDNQLIERIEQEVILHSEDIQQQAQTAAQEKLEQIQQNFAIEYKKQEEFLDEIEVNFKKEIAFYEKEKRTEIEKILKDTEIDYRNGLSFLKETYDKERKQMTSEHENFKIQLSDELNELKSDIAKQEQLKAAIINALVQEEKLNNNQEFFKISISTELKTDISRIKSLASTLSKPEVLLKFLYEVYYKNAMEGMFSRVLGLNKNKSGIYKITNIANKKVYIGKTTNFINRWRTHAKRGCGIERLTGQFYDALYEEGLENFTWEILELCEKEELSEREKYWIRFYDSIHYGYNMKEG